MELICPGVPVTAWASMKPRGSKTQADRSPHSATDGVKEVRISAAACFLPLTTNPALPANLGTRHRAALGITEESDCLSLVVSEETGDMSVAAFGEIQQGLSLREVDERVNAHFGVGKSGARPSGFAEALSEEPPKSAEKVRSS